MGRLGVGVALVLVLASACSGETYTAAVSQLTTTTHGAPDLAWPVPDWEVIDARTAGLDPAPLATMAAEAGAGGSACLVVTKDGRLVSESYWQGTTPMTELPAYSVTKSITSTLVGIAVDRGLIDIEQPASTYITEWKGTPSESVTIRNLLAMDSGRRQDFRTDYSEMAVKAFDKTAFSIALDQEHAPGTFWAYNNAAVQDLERVLELATASDVGQFAWNALFQPIGMTSHIDRDGAGNTLTFSGARASCRDLARFGLLHLRGGEWAGRQIVSSAWVHAATSPSQALNREYGLLWWVGEDHYAAVGMNHQLVVVFPASGVVVVRMGGPEGQNGEQFGLQDIVRGVTRAVGG